MGLATIGRVCPERGTDQFVEAMLRLLPDLPGAVAPEGMASAAPCVGSQAGCCAAFADQGRAGTAVPKEMARAAAEADGIEAVHDAIWRSSGQTR